jgi:biotin transport system permease protein/energy-coupling factor transport system permease protein
MAMRSAQTVFRYKTERGLLHRIPAALKLFLLLPLSVLCMPLPPCRLGVGIVFLVMLAFTAGFSLREQLTDLKPAFYYATLMYALSLFSAILEWFPALLETGETSHLSAILLPRFGFLQISLRLVLIVQLSALLFRSTSSIELRDSIGTVERFIRLRVSHLPLLGKRIAPNPRFSQSIALFLGFIPEIFETWKQINLAWKARAGKQGLRKIKTLVFVLVSISLEKAAGKANALAARS